MTCKDMKKCSTFLIIKEMQIKTILRFQLTSVRTAINKVITTNLGEDAVKQEHLYTVGENANEYNHYGKQHEESSKS
jgi:hypothetical protein